MLRHSREYVRHQRERYIAKRRRQFARWLGEIDYGAGYHRNESGCYPLNAPRPLAVREDEFWDGRRLGLLSKWNGTCTCGNCRGPRHRQERARIKAESRRMMAECG